MCIELIKRFGFVKFAVDNGAIIKNIIVPAQLTGGTGIFNPSITKHNGRIYFVVRHVDFTVWASSTREFTCMHGPMVNAQYEMQHWTTRNYVGEFDNDYNVKWVSAVDTSKFDVTPLARFVGLEDCRLVVWNNSLLLIGCRRDHSATVEGRIEVSEIVIDGSTNVTEISRTQIPVIEGTYTFCEKNWMPVIDDPYNFVRWTNPTQVVEYCDGRTVQKMVSGEVKMPRSLKGGTPIIKWRGYYLGLVHETDLYNSNLSREESAYRHRFIVWDAEWNIVKISESFSFMTGQIEFANGLILDGDNIVITFGFMDTSAYVLVVPEAVIHDFVF